MVTSVVDTSLETINFISNTEHSYPILLGSSLVVKELPNLLNNLQASKVILATEANLAQLYVAEIKAAVTQQESLTFILPGGEQAKTLTVASKMLQFLAENQIDRQAVIVAIGGGSVGDVSGLVAALYLRGLRLIHIPTSLLAMVDSAVGGKVAVNLLHKNQIGTFYQPSAVLVDINLLESLPDKEYVSGLAEVVKYAICFDKDFFVWLQNNKSKILSKDKGALKYFIAKSIKFKLALVQQDILDNKQRKLLNFGHTFAHILEKFSDYNLLHGEAVAIGMLVAGLYSVIKLGLDKRWFEQLVVLLDNFKLPTKLEDLSLPEPELVKLKSKLADEVLLLSCLKQDKKNTEQTLLVGLTEMGNAELIEYKAEEFLLAIYKIVGI